jgi:NAD(P)-dependent dehydrogenase (short-subunit alcohol dehydrogenase family)
MDLSLADCGVLVTGGASGIGRACVEAFAAEGARVQSVDIQAGADWQADVTDEGEVKRVVEGAARRLGGLDVVVCCAGISGPVGTRVPEVSVSDWDAVMAVNVKGAFLTVKHAVGHLARSRHPAVVLLASDSSFVASEAMAPYCTSKGAVLMLGRSLATDLRDQAIRVNCVCPGVVDTPMSRNDLSLPDGFAGVDYPVQSAHDVARLVLFLASPASMPVNGTHLLSDWGLLARSWLNF